MSFGGGVSVPSLQTANANTPQVKPLETPLVGAPQPQINPQSWATGPNWFAQQGTPFGAVSSPIGNAWFSNRGIFEFNQSKWADVLQQRTQNTLLNAGEQFGKLKQTVRPGFSQFRQAGLATLRSQQQRTVSNLQDTLGQRRVLGSSFADSQISQTQAQFAQEKANFIAQSYLQELNASTQLTQLQHQATAQAYQNTLNQMNFESTYTADLGSRATSLLASLAETQGQLDLSAAQTNAQGAIAQAQLQMQEQQLMLQAAEFNAQLQAMEMMGIGQLAGGLLGNAMGMFGGGMSDRRVKRDITQIGEWFNGLPLYLFRFVFGPRWFIGFMAQDVEKVMPEAVYEVAGIKHVNYSLAVR